MESQLNQADRKTADAERNHRAFAVATVGYGCRVARPQRDAYRVRATPHRTKMVIATFLQS
jgi:hypothetical protein